MDKTTSTEFVITHITESGTAFGVRTDNGESIHISPRLLEQANADIDHLCDGIIVPNTVEAQGEVNRGNAFGFCLGILIWPTIK